MEQTSYNGEMQQKKCDAQRASLYQLQRAIGISLQAMQDSAPRSSKTKLAGFGNFFPLSFTYPLQYHAYLKRPEYLHVPKRINQNNFISQ